MSSFSLHAKNKLDLHGLRSSAFSLYLAEQNQPTVIVTTRHSDLNNIAANLKTFNPKLRVFVFPPRHGSPYLHTSMHEAIKRDRLAFFLALQSGQWDAVITQPAALIEPLPPRDRIARPYLEIQVNDFHDPAELSIQLESMGYCRVDLVSQVGEYARRGGILDVFPLTDDQPTRIEFLGDEVEEIRLFEADNQRTLRQLQRVVIPPHGEWIPTAADRKVFEERGGNAWNKTKARQHFLELVSTMQTAGTFSGYEHWTRFFFRSPQHLLQLVPDQTLLFLDDPDAITGELDDLLSDHQLQSEQAQKGKQVFAEPLSLWGLSRSVIEVPDGVRAILSHHLALGRGESEMGTRPIVRYESDPLRGLTEWLHHVHRYAVVIVCSSKGAHDRLAEIVQDHDIDARELVFPMPSELQPGLYLARGHLDKGFEWTERKLAVISDHDLFPPQRRRGRVSKSRKKAFITDLRDLKVNDFVVHADHGIGRFMGLVEVEVAGQSSEMMALEYKGQDRLYVALNQLHKIQRHGSSQSGTTLDKLGGSAWVNTRKRVKKAVKKLAINLVKLYAERVVVSGIRLSADTTWQQEFEDSFEFEPTPDQLRSSAEIKEDLTSGAKPMDRVLVGDVGFGKTEVAMRMAFKLAVDGYQVAVLCPTTVLAFQHFMTFTARFSAFPVKIAWISRFTPAKEARKILEETAQGSVDILIGTHRILSKDVQFKNLGGVIVDEEQRFGVGHKEKLKSYRKRAHVLSMSATPIPRTLNMAMTGIRDISIIETPPSNRLAISTAVMAYRDGVVENAIRYELDRNGQVYFIHNRVQNMPEIARTVADLVPQARVGMAHGQMDSRQLESVMIAFMKHEIDVLVCSTIIENGVDIPNANTMIVNRADHFGLSQLYQLRGRIGRSDRSAFAYLMVPPKAQMTPEARTRLAALEEFSDLGSGFRIAAMDMEVRGAGNMLGPEQAGHIQAIGYELFIKLLEEAVAEVRGKPVEDEFECLLNLKLGAGIPRSYIENTNQRLHYYKLIYSARDREELEEIHSELDDCYGVPPEETELAFAEARLKQKLASWKVLAVDREGSQLKIRFHPDAEVNSEILIRWMKTNPKIQLTPEGVLTLPCSNQIKAQESIEWIDDQIHQLMVGSHES